jgi:hypothetical protein
MYRHKRTRACQLRIGIDGIGAATSSVAPSPSWTTDIRGFPSPSEARSYFLSRSTTSPLSVTVPIAKICKVPMGVSSPRRGAFRLCNSVVRDGPALLRRLAACGAARPWRVVPARREWVAGLVPSYVDTFYSDGRGRGPSEPSRAAPRDG